MFNPKKILVTTDFSGESDNALLTAIDIAKKFDSRIYLMHVLELIHTTAIEFLPVADIEKAKTGFKDFAMDKLRDEAARAKPDKGIVIDAVVKYGDPIDEILKEIDGEKIDLLVIAPHKRHRPWNLFFSHLSDEIVKKSSCKTLLVKN